MRNQMTAGRTVERLETASAAGYRFGMSPETLIGRRLARVFGLRDEIPRDMGVLIQSIEDRRTR